MSKPYTRDIVARVNREHGAWLIQRTDDHAQFRSSDENYGAAGSLATAKRLAVEWARAAGAEGRPRWLTPSDGIWTLEMRWPDDHDYWNEGDDE